MPARDDDHHLGWILARGPIVTGPSIKNVNFYGAVRGMSVYNVTTDKYG